MKVFYIYKTPRKDIYNNYLKGNAPNDPLFGLTCMSNFGILASFRDDYHQTQLKKFIVPLEKISLLNISRTLKLIPDFNTNDLIFSTNDGCGLSFSLIKKMFRINKPHVYQTIGLKHARFNGLPKWVLLRNIQLYRNLLSMAERIVFVTPTEKTFLKKK